MLKRPRLPTRREPRQDRALTTRRNILAAAAKALKEQGAEVSMTRIAEMSGYGIGTVYEYFPNRASLLCELMHQICEDELAEIMALVPTLRDAPLRVVAERVIGMLVGWAADHHVLTRLVMLEVVPTLGSDGLEDLVPMVAALLGAEIHSRIDDTRVLDPERTARFILTAVEAIIEDAAVDRPQWLTEPEFTLELVALVMGYVMQPRGGAA
jgi:AcrR family transcriptional regulator